MFRLTPLGFGSAFNSEEYGNNSWYFEYNDELYIIDCGFTIFNELKKLRLDWYNQIHFIITHMHGDHVGSLPTAIQYLYYKYHITPNIVTHYDLKRDMINYLGITGIEQGMYALRTPLPNTVDFGDPKGIVIEFHKTKHDLYIRSYSLAIIKESTELILYSGDTTSHFNGMNDPLFIALCSLDNAYTFNLELKAVYLDISLKKSPSHAHAHLYNNRACDRIENEFKKNNTEIVVMHLDDTIENYRDKLNIYTGFDITIGGEK